MAAPNADSREWTIYKITSPSGRVYIGKTKNYHKRVREHKHFANSGRHSVLSRSYKKYGFENHKIEVLETFVSDNLYCQGKEMFWIRSYMANVNKYPYMNGLNMTDGGDGQIGRPLSIETKIKMSEKRKGVKISESHKAALSRANLGNKFNLGRKQSPELIEKRMKKMRGRVVSEQERLNKTLNNIKLRGKSVTIVDIKSNEKHEFVTIKLAAKFLKICRDRLSLYLKGESESLPKNLLLSYNVKFS